MLDNRTLNYSVPQGSCLGPVLFLLYASRLFEVVKKHLPSVHGYADDTQLSSVRRSSYLRLPLLQLKMVTVTFNPLSMLEILAHGLITICL